MFELFSVVLAIVALVIARKALNEAASLRASLQALEARGLQVPSAPLAPTEEPIPTRLPEAVSPPAPVDAAISPRESPPSHETLAPAQPPPLPSAEPGFEERIGTRWVVWLGGLTLALGGFFMVRYSIEAGLLGPGVRILLGGAFALALLF